MLGHGRVRQDSLLAASRQIYNCSFSIRLDVHSAGVLQSHSNDAAIANERTDRPLAVSFGSSAMNLWKIPHKLPMSYDRPIAITLNLASQWVWAASLAGFVLWISTIASAQEPIDQSSTEATRTASVDPNQLVLQAVRRAVWGPSMSCRIEQTTNLFGQQMIGLGHCSQAGEGSGQVKMVMRSSSGKSQSTFLQVSDGRLLWSITTDGSPPRRVYLDRVRQSIGSTASSPQSPLTTSLYLAIGGQAELLRTLYHRYRYIKIFAAQVNGEPVWQLVGTLRTGPLELRAHTLNDDLICTVEPNEFVPTDVRITLVRGTQRDLIPLKIEYFKRTLNKQGELASFEPLSTVIYSEIQVGSHIDETEFAFDDQTAEIEDETADYLPLVPLASAPAPPIR